MGLRKLSVKDAKSAMPGCTLVTNLDEVNKRPPFMPGVARLIPGDEIRFDVAIEDKDDKPAFVWGQDSTLNDAYFILATLVRGERELENYHLFPSMLLRTMLKKRGAKHSLDSAAPEYLRNKGIIEMLPTQRLTDYMMCYYGKSIVVEDVDEDEDVWVLNFAKIREDKIDLTKEPRPLRDELWTGGKARFYEFSMSEIDAVTPVVAPVVTSTVEASPTPIIGG